MAVNTASALPKRARPGGPGQHQPAEAGQGTVGRMPSRPVNTASALPESARAGGPGQLQPAEAGQGTVGRMPSRPVKTAAGDVVSPAAFVITGLRRMPDR